MLYSSIFYNNLRKFKWLVPDGNKWLRVGTLKFYSRVVDSYSI